MCVQRRSVGWSPSHDLHFGTSSRCVIFTVGFSSAFVFIHGGGCGMSSFVSIPRAILFNSNAEKTGKSGEMAVIIISVSTLLSIPGIFIVTGSRIREQIRKSSFEFRINFVLESEAFEACCCDPHFRPPKEKKISETGSNSEKKIYDRKLRERERG